MGTFETKKNAADFSAGTGATDISLVASKWNEFGTLTVPAQQAIQVGVGVVTPNGTDSRERAVIRIDSTAGQITGKFRIRVADANENREETVVEGLYSEFSGSGKLLGVSEVTAFEDDKIKLECYPDATVTLDYSDSNNDIQIPVTVHTRR